MPRSAGLFFGRLALTWVCGVFASCGAGIPEIQASPPPTNTAPSTARMALLLEEVTRSMDPMKNSFVPHERIPRFQELLRTAPVQTVMEIQSALATEYINGGQTAAALDELNRLERLLPAYPSVATSKNLSYLSLQRATALLWQGEKDNCFREKRSEYCLFPILAGGVQHDQRSTREAFGALTNHLQRFSSDLRGVWLLTIAAMRLGEYPAQVPEAWRIPPAAFAAEYDIKRFTDVAPALGLDREGLAGGSIAEDFDRDGDLDLMTSSWNPDGQLQLFRNQGDGTFEERTAHAGLLGETGGLNLMQTDYNNDGYADVWILRGAWYGEAASFPNSLLRNNGDGTFTDVTEEAKVLSFHPTQTAVWLDYNNDGWIDLFIGNESTARNRHPCELYRNNRDGTFTECAGESGLAVNAFVKAVAAGDFNQDGRADLYLSCLDRPNLLFRNDGPSTGSANGPWRFSDVSVPAGVTEPIRSFPAWFWDYDNDGRLDLFVSGYQIRSIGDFAAEYLRLPHKGERPRLYRNNGNGTFSDLSLQAGLDRILLSMGANFGDLDNDGWLDFYVGTGDPDLSTVIPNRMFRNAEGARFQEVTGSGGFGQLHKGHGISFADFDNDGDQDIHIVMGGAYTGDLGQNMLFENPGHGHHWLTLTLEGKQSNRAALGARIKVVLETSSGERVLYRTVGTGGSFGASPLRQEIGLGTAAGIKRVEVFWPVTGRTQVLTGFLLDRFYLVTEGVADPILQNRSPLKFKR